MIQLWEQYGYKQEHKNAPRDLSKWKYVPDEGQRLFSRERDNRLCYKFWKAAGEKHYHFETTYYVGIDWLPNSDATIYVEPKISTESSQVNYLSLLTEAFSDAQNSAHLDDLFEVDFSKEFIPIEQSQDLLTPLLVFQYINLLKEMVRKGLRKSYNKVERNLNARVKGKVLITQTIKQNLVRNKNTRTVCRFEEFSINSVENKVLKKALQFAKASLANTGLDVAEFQENLSYITPAFEHVDDVVNIHDLRQIRPNPLFPEYDKALKLARIILKKYGYTISRAGGKKIETPPFWIDMSKLFELYLFAQLRKRFSKKGEVIYHPRVHQYEPDFLLKSRDGQYVMVVDAKYKPQYKDSQVAIEDIRQLSGYARMKGVYQLLGIEDISKVIECLVVYSDQDSDIDHLMEVDLRSAPESNFVGFYKVGIKLPTL